MGWCSGTDVFDRIARFVLNTNATDDEKCEVLSAVVEALEDQDWDCQSDSSYWDDPIVQRVFKAIHPDWYED